MGRERKESSGKAKGENRFPRVEDMLETRPRAVRKSLGRCCFGQSALFPVMTGKTKLNSQAFSCVLDMLVPCGWGGGAGKDGGAGQGSRLSCCCVPRLAGRTLRTSVRSGVLQMEMAEVQLAEKQCYAG